MKISQIIKLTEFRMYFLIGGTATIIDWCTFWVTTTYFHFYYQFGLLASYILAGVFHYTANKTFTFACQSKKIGSQFSVFIMVTLTSLLCSMGVMFVLINVFGLNKLLARMLTTALILMPNYLLHKYITFNKKIFLQPKPEASP